MWQNEQPTEYVLLEGKAKLSREYDCYGNESEELDDIWHNNECKTFSTLQERIIKFLQGDRKNDYEAKKLAKELSYWEEDDFEFQFKD